MTGSPQATVKGVSDFKVAPHKQCSTRTGSSLRDSPLSTVLQTVLLLLWQVSNRLSTFDVHVFLLWSCTGIGEIKSI